MGSIREFQNLMYSIYFSRDSQRGAERTFRWLQEEVDELGEAMQKAYHKAALEDEFADVIAWLASLANILGVDLEEATFKKYNSRCPKCSLSPCQCPFE